MWTSPSVQARREIQPGTPGGLTSAPMTLFYPDITIWEGCRSGLMRSGRRSRPMYGTEADFYSYHEAGNSFANWPEYNQLIGIGWRNKSFGKAITLNADGSVNIIPAGSGEDTSHGPWRDLQVKKRGSHPIHAGLPASWMAAELELWRYARGPAENLTVLSYAQTRTACVFPSSGRWHMDPGSATPRHTAMFGATRWSRAVPAAPRSRP